MTRVGEDRVGWKGLNGGWLKVNVSRAKKREGEKGEIKENNEAR